MSALQLIADTTVMAADSGGVFDLIDTLIGSTEKAIRSGSVVAAIAFVFFQGIVSRGAMARIVISGIAAAIFLYIIFNVTDLQDRVDNTVNAAPAIGASAHLDPAPAPAAQL